MSIIAAGDPVMSVRKKLIVFLDSSWTRSTKIIRLPMIVPFYGTSDFPIVGASRFNFLLDFIYFLPNRRE